MEKSNYVIWLPSWFPSKKDPLNGDFIYRHAKATALYLPVTVVHIVKDNNCSSFSREIIQENNLTIIHIYYPSISKIKIIDKIVSLLYFIWLSFREVADIINKKKKPLVFHVHITQKALIAGWLLSLKYTVPVLLSEHSSKFLQNDLNSYYNRNFLFRKLLSFLLNRMSKITVVSAVLGDALSCFSGVQNVLVIPNVVDQTIFKPNNQVLDKPFELIHISTLNANKNLEAIFKAFEQLHQQHKEDIRLTIIGPQEYGKKWFKPEHSAYISILPERSQEQLAEMINNAHALLLYSRYETFGCVIIESLACGKPVILADMPISREVIGDKHLGLFAAPNNPEALALKIIELKQQYKTFKPDDLVHYVEEKFSFRAVGKQFLALYGESINL